MNKRFIKIFFKYLAFWISIFFLVRLSFLLLHFSYSRDTAVSQLLLSFLYGLRHDSAVAAYIMFFYTPILIAYFLVRKKMIARLISIYTIIILSVVLIISITDSGLYNYWKYRIDSTILDYANTPREMFASASIIQYVAAFAVFLVLIIGLYRIYRIFIHNDLLHEVGLTVNSKYKALLWLGILPLLFLLGRGSLGVAPVNVGSVYFSDDIFADHLAINPVFSFLQDVFERGRLETNPGFYSPETARSILNRNKIGAQHESRIVLKKKHPNIVIVILESFGYQTIESLGGRSGIAPNINALTREGIFFKNFYASGPSSRKGIVAILSGFPAQPKSSIIAFERKTVKLPHMAQLLKGQGYHSIFLYGGSLDFAHFNSYLVTGGFDELYSLNNFLTETNKGKWGVHDEVTFNKLYDLLNSQKSPVFISYFSLSSHEPYIVPARPIMELNSLENKYYNSIHYTDSCLGVFVNKLKNNKELWDNTLLIVLADHSTRIGNLPIYDKQSFHIPMIWTGGAVDTIEIDPAFGSQTDIINTLYYQISGKTVNNIYGKNLFAKEGNDYAFYTFNSGFSIVTENDAVYYDNNLGKFIDTNQESDTSLTNLAKAYYQYMITDYLTK